MPLRELLSLFSLYWLRLSRVRSLVVKEFITTKCVMSLRSPPEHENADLRHAGMDCRHPGSQDAPETSMSTWIPALHAGMTQSRGSA